MHTATLQEEIWQWVAAVPPGKVASYGQIARLAGYPRHARYVGAILRQLPIDSSLPWFRILRSNGELAFPAGSKAWHRQKNQLADDGVLLINQRVQMRLYQWDL